MREEATEGAYGGSAVAPHRASPSGPCPRAKSQDDDQSLWLVLPTNEAAGFVASVRLGIARRSGAELIAGNGPSGEAILRIVGTPTANAVACYLVQEALWLNG